MTTDPQNHQGFTRLQQRASRGDGEAAATLLILQENWARPKAEAFVDRDGIDFASMLSAHDEEDVNDGTCTNPDPDGGRCGCGPYWSSGATLMLQLAWNLWAGNNASAINLARLIDTCGDRMLGLAVVAIKTRNGGQLPKYDRARSANPQDRTRSVSAWSPDSSNAQSPTLPQRRAL